MSQHHNGSALKPIARVVEMRSSSQNRHGTTLNGVGSPILNGQEMSSLKTTKQTPNQKTSQYIPPSSKPQPSVFAIQQSYKEKLQDLEARLGEENQYLRETTQNTLKRLDNANLVVDRIRKEKEDVEAQNVKLVNELERKNSSAKELTDTAEKLRKENASLNKKINDLNAIIANMKSQEQTIKQEKTGTSLQKQLGSKIKQTNNGDIKLETQNNFHDHIYQRINSKQLPSNSLTPLPSESGRQSFQPQAQRPSYLFSQKHSFDRSSILSRESSLNNSKRSSRSRSNFAQAELSPKQSARMEVLFEEIGIIRKNLMNGGRVSHSIANKLFSLINHLTNALNKRNDDNVELKSKLRRYQQMILDNSTYRNPQEISLTFQREESSLIHKHNYTSNDRFSTKSIGRPRSSFDTLQQTGIKNQSRELINPVIANTLEHSNTHSRNQSAESNKNRYNFVYKRMSLEDYLKRKIELFTSMQLVFKVIQVVDKNLLNKPKVISASDFNILYCDGECPINQKIRVELKPSKDDKVSTVSQLEMIESLGYLFEGIFKSIQLTNSEQQKSFDKSISPAFLTIISNLKADKSKRLNMQKLKLLLQKLQY